MHFEEKLGGDTVFRGKIISVAHDSVRLENGRVSTREVVRHPGAVAVIGRLGRRLILVRQYRYAVGRELLEIPAGKLEADEKPEAAALRELEEETGMACKGALAHLADYYGSPGILGEAIHVYFAEVERHGPQNPDEDEFLSCCEIDIDELERLIAAGEINDGKTVFAFALAKARGLLD